MEGPLPLSSLRLLVPPLRVMSAAMWKVVCLRNMKHYGKVEEFVSMVSEAIPDLLTDRQMRLLTLGLRARMMLQLLSSKQPEDLTAVKTHLNTLLLSSSNQVCPGDEALEENFVRLVQNLLEDPKEREHFLKSVFPVEFGPDFDSALENLLCEFFSRLEEMLHIPDFKQTAVWISDSTSVLVECVPKEDDLRVLLRSKACGGRMTNKDSRVSSDSEERLLSSLSIPPSLQKTNAKDVTSNLQTQNQRQSEHDYFQKTKSSGIQNAWLASNEETYIVQISTSEQTPAEECRESNRGALPTCQPPSTSSQSPVLSGSVIGRRPRQRVAHKCAQCGKCFIYRYQLREHQRVHTRDYPYKCSQCRKAFRTSSDMSAHRKTQCTDAAYLCIKCGDSFQTAQDKFKHRCGLSEQKLDCSKCRKSFKTKSLLEKHELTHTQTQTYTCRQCGLVYPSIGKLKNHQKTHPPQLSNQCRQCGKFLSSAATLKIHEMRHQRKRTGVCPNCVCESCGKVFETKNQLKQHMRSHTGEKPYECAHCGKRFSIPGNLTIHVRTHTGDKPFLCSDCGKAFVSAGELQVHRRLHTGERPYECTACGKGFTMAGHLKVHMRGHTGERPYGCSECGKRFKTGTELKRHNLKHTGVRPYVCQLCGKTYTRTNHLNRHLKTHSAV